MSLKKKSIANFIGGVIPAVASLLTVPVIVSRLGNVEYGLFTLVTAIVGYFALIDINVTAGSVKYLSEHHAREEHDQVNRVISFGGFIYFMIGLLGGLGIFFFADKLVTSFFNVPADLHETARRTLQVAAVAFFFGQMQVYLLSVPQALQRYDLSGKIESVFGALTSISTVVVVLLGGGLVQIILVRLVLSVINCGLLINIIQKIMPFIQLVKPDRDTVNKLASFSAYSYLSRIASITYVNGDKMLLGAFLDLHAVSLYSVPSLLVHRVVSLVFRLGQVLFPVTSALVANNQLDELRHIYLMSTRYYTYLNASLCLMLAIFSREILHYWAGSVFDSSAALVLIIISAAAFFESLTNLPSFVNDGLGKPRNTGMLALMRALVGLAFSYIGIRYAGYVGAAWAYLISSVIFSIAFLIFVHQKSIPISLHTVYKKSYFPTVIPLIIFMITAYIFSDRPILRLAWFFTAVFIATASLAAYGWIIICLPKHHAPLKEFIWRQLRLSRD